MIHGLYLPQLRPAGFAQTERLALSKSQPTGKPFIIEGRFPVPDSGGARRDRTDDLMLAKHALSQLSYGPFVVCAPSGARTLASARRRLRGWQSLAALHANARQSKRKEAAAVIRLPTADSRLPIMVGLGGLEPPTSRLSSARSNQLSYKPKTRDRSEVQTPSPYQRLKARLLTSEKKERRRRRVPPMRSDFRSLISELGDVKRQRRLRTDRRIPERR